MKNRKMKNFAKIGILALLAAVLTPNALYSQVRAGASFLTVLPGARPQGMAESYTGITDDLHAIFANPAAAGFFRDWQWSASYTKWIADVYSTSFLYGQRVRMPWSRDFRFSVGTAFQGMPDFNSSDQPGASAQANDWIIVGNFAQPLNALSENLALGTNVKYYHSTLAKYSASAWIADVGIFYKTGVFRLFSANSLLPQARLSAGAAITQMGQPLKFMQEGTPLPTTFRAGISMIAGSHNGLQTSLALDYVDVRDEKSRFSMGAELSWNNLLSLRTGYFFGNNEMRLLNDVTFGVSLRLDDRRGNVADWLPGRNNAMRLDVGAIQGNELVSGTYRGTLTHHPIAPQKFSPLQPLSGAVITTDSVRLAWEDATDPDPFDRTRYWVVVDTNRSRLETLLASLDESSDAFFTALEDSFLAKQEVSGQGVTLSAIDNGTHYWSVIAVDSDRHTRAMQHGKERISSFNVIAPVLQITDVAFEPDRWITKDNYQGKIRVTVANNGQRQAQNFTLSLFDSSLSIAPGGFANGNALHKQEKLAEIRLPDLAPGREHVLEFDWHTELAGLHRLTAAVNRGQPVQNRVGNRLSRAFYTIPKGSISTDDSALAVVYSNIRYDLPFIAEICFDSSSSAIKTDYLKSDILPATLPVLAQRLRATPELKIRIQGFIDPNSGENDLALADARAAAVRDSLLQLGVNAAQMTVLPGKKMAPRRMPRDPQDGIWVLQERRFAKISTDKATESILFQPVLFTDVEALINAVTFFAELKSPLPLQQSYVRLTCSQGADTLGLQAFHNHGQLVALTSWQVPIEREPCRSAWLKAPVRNQLIVVDSLGRVFRSRPGQIVLQSESVLRERKLTWPLKFAQTDPLYDFYWSKLFTYVRQMLEDKNMRMRFVGHACAIGPTWVNQALSEKRAMRFQNKFLQYVRDNYPGAYERILARLDAPIGLGETAPLSIRRTTGEVIILGDNNKPLGRQLNRHIAIDFYSPERPLKEITNTTAAADGQQ